MRHQRTLSLVIGALFLALPVASATWYNAGSYEPDTKYDTSGGWMHLEADDSPDASVRQVYFNVYPTYYLTATNANVGALGTGVRQVNLVHYYANLGVWKDCNLDGYIGMAESAVDAYRAELLPENHVCPADADNPLSHNDGTWVWEMIAIGNLPDNNTAPMIVDTDVAVWGDIGEPGRVPGTSCPLAPLPHGTSAGTGAFIRWADCLANFRITETVNALDPNGSLGLGFKCDGMTDEECAKNPQQSRSLLNQELPESLFGNPRTKETGTLQKDPENEGETAFTTWDCRQRGVVLRDPTGEEGERGSLSNWTVTDPTGGSLSIVFGPDNQAGASIADEEGVYAWTATPAPDVNDPTWSVAAGLNQTADGTSLTGECDPQDGRANEYNATHELVFFYADGDFEGTAQAPGKNQADNDFTYADGSTDETYTGDIYAGDTKVLSNVTTGERTPGHYGPGNTLLRNRWTSGSVWVYYVPQTVNDETLEPDDADWWTFYARVGDAAINAHGLALPAGTAKGTYGSLNCPVIGAGAEKAGGWECDPAKWYLDPQGKDISEPQMQRVGAQYNLMDVDCFDGRILQGAAHASLAPLSEGGVCS